MRGAGTENVGQLPAVHECVKLSSPVTLPNPHSPKQNTILYMACTGTYFWDRVPCFGGYMQERRRAYYYTLPCTLCAVLGEPTPPLSGTVDPGITFRRASLGAIGR